ncbi:MAG: hypothetical protein J7545_10270 [Roseofilum sp. SBFL]|uniref:hypothetical protein n=1 Tax=unclassified Roseofilum TaxID=2620099 RepID=UPI001B1FAF2C|nr:MULTISPECIES: hypothetical protein [unclassified Roseofilum]MBP0012687.1 hypothetical protein [Roseofilum sp. SID3]MBP0026346.1 hypothetical protein [Roseofilum sp. SID2]MBP0039997.1 hypothetical protein [Roseofilum sp. SID1]MBP0042342.1 hypothetical protein [Roseofilum sp. SBFL]
MKLQELIDSIEQLSIEDQDYLFDLIRKRRIEQRRLEIAAHAEMLKQEFQQGTAKRGTVDDLIADLLEDDDGDRLEQ